MVEGNHRLGGKEKLYFFISLICCQELQGFFISFGLDQYGSNIAFLFPRRDMMGFPDVTDIRKYGGIVRTAAGRQNSCDFIFLSMFFPCSRHAVDRMEGVSYAETGKPGGFAAENDFPFFRKAFSCFYGKPGIFFPVRLVLEYLFFYADNWKSPVIISESKRIDGFRFSAFSKFVHRFIGNIF